MSRSELDRHRRYEHPITTPWFVSSGSRVTIVIDLVACDDAKLLARK